MYQRLALTFIFTFSFFSSLYSQIDPEAIGYYNDALRFSTFSPYGTARFQAMGGVNAALGGDLSSLAGNPAGLGFYNRSEASISTGFGFASTTSSFSLDNSTNNENRDYFSFPNLGVVFNMKSKNDASPYRGGSFGIGLTRMNSFQNRFYYSGINDQNSMNDFFLDLVNGIPKQSLDDEFDDIQSLGALSYFTYLVNPVDEFNQNNTDYFAYDQDKPSKQEETVFTRGAINQWNLTYGGNFNDRVYIGASLGLPQVRYISDKSYKETKIGGDTLDQFRFNESLKVKGGGINFKIGAIVKAADWIRLGASFQTPTFYSLNEDFSYYIKANYNTFQSPTGYFVTQEEESTTPGIYKYNLTTPFRASAGISLFAGKSGFIAADIEYVPYNRAQLRESATYATANNSTFEGDNKTIKNLYKPVVNMNIGAELRKDIYRFRGGFSMQKDPYNIGDIDRKVVNISGGAGIRLDVYYIDLAVVNSHYNSLYQSYTLNSGQQPTANVKNRVTNVVITAGVIF